MRDIKFRGLYKESWVYGSLIMGIDDNGEKFYQIENADFNDYRKYEVDSESIGQYIGQKDKNGVDIYENDTVKAPGYRTISFNYPERIAHVIYDEDRFTLNDCGEFEWDELVIINKG